MRNLNNTDVEKLANEYIESNDSLGQVGEYDGFIAGFNAALEELQKEYTEIGAYVGTDSFRKYMNVLVKRKDLR